MIELTVKTLDSQNHAFSVPDDTTVKQLKEKIAESISFPVDSQRLIYCGRVLQDDKNLSEYDVNGKVIHLVQRPPPQASRPNGGQSGTRTGTGSQQRRGNHHFRQPRIDGNAMYLGAMAFPADLMDAQGIQAPPSSHSLSLSRLVLARKMLRRATSVLHRLENPPTQEGNEADTPSEEGETASASNGENGASGSNAVPPVMPFQGSIAQAAQAATAAAIAAAVSAAHAAGVPNITIVRGGQQQGDSERVDVHIGDSVQEVVADQEVTVTTTDATADTTNDTPMQDASSPPETSETQAASQGSSTDAEAGTTSTPTNSEDRTQRSLEPPRTSRMAELLDELANVNRRLQPFMAQYHQLMQDDPVYEANASSVQESQRVFSLVSEIMHYLSHAYHALSDIMCDFSQAPPRSLRCRPVLIQHSAVLQAGIPIQAQINVMANRGNSNSSSNTPEQENSSRGATNGSVSATETATEAGVGSTAATTATTPVVPAAATTTSSPTPTPASSTPAEGQAQMTQQEQRSRVQLGTGQETTFNITPGNVEFFMEVGPGSITIDSLEATVVTNGNAGGMGNGGVEANVVGGSFPWGSPPPPEFIQNLMQAVAGHMIGRGVGVAQNSGTQSQPAGGAGAAAAGAATGVGTGTGQNSQARGNTATHPTTATQTRSTSRPHVHLAPAMQGLGASNFDPFLPCNSHHIRSRTRHAVHPFQQHFVANVEPPVQTQTAATTSASAPTNADEGDEARATPSASQQSERDSPVQSQAQSDPQTPPQPRPFVVVHAQPPLTPRSQDLPSQPQATPQQPPQPQPSQQSQPPPNEQAAQNLYDLISNMFSSMPAGAGTSINFGPLYQTVPLTPQAQSRTQSSSANTARSSSTSSGATGGPPPGMAFYMNMLNGQGPTGAAGESHPFNIPMFAQMFEGLTGALGGALRGQGQGTTLADFLQSLPDHSYTEGSSLFIDFMMTLARSMTFQDIIALSFGSPEVVNRLRPQLREFVGQRVLQGEPMSEENISRGVDRLLRELRPYLDVMLQARLREDVDLITTTVRYNQIRLPEAIGLIMAEGNEATFGRQMVQWCTTYIRELTAIIRHCCLDSNQGLDMIMRNYVQQLTRGVHPSIQQWTVNSSLVHMRNYISHQNVPLEDIQRFLVYRIPGGTPSPSTEDSSAPAEQIADVAQSETVNAEVRPEPMEMDTNIGEPQATPPPPIEAEHITSTLAMDTESLPDVVLGSEAWHNVLPSEWVPIITRDTQRQRRQSTQPPFSDAYLSGMPSKRRKVVTSAKPQGNMSQIITESVRRSLEDAGVRPVSGIETAGDDLELQAAYREQMRSSVQQTLINNPDFTPDRFPNATKYFAK